MKEETPPRKASPYGSENEKGQQLKIFSFLVDGPWSMLICISSGKCSSTRYLLLVSRSLLARIVTVPWPWPSFVSQASYWLLFSSSFSFHFLETKQSFCLVQRMSQIGTWVVWVNVSLCILLCNLNQIKKNWKNEKKISSSHMVCLFDWTLLATRIFSYYSRGDH